MATVQEIYNEIDRIENSKSGIAGAIEEKGVEVPAGARIDEYPELVRQIQQGDTSDCVKFTPQTLSDEQKEQARANIGAQEALVPGTNIKKFAGRNLLGSGDAVLYLDDVEDDYIVFPDSSLNFIVWSPSGDGFGVVQTGAGARVWNHGKFVKHFCHISDGWAIEVDAYSTHITFLSGAWGGTPVIKTASEVTSDPEYISADGTIREMDYAVKYTAQSLTDAQKAQARTNIGATTPEVFWCTYGTTTDTEIQNAYNAGKVCLAVRSNDNKVYMLGKIDSTDVRFYVQQGQYQYELRKTIGGSWSTANTTLQRTNDKVTTITNASTDAQYPSAKAVYDFVKSLADANGLTMP